jgi:hypothetical protein
MTERRGSSLELGSRHLQWRPAGGVLPKLAGPFPGRPLLVKGSSVYLGLRGAVLRTDDGGSSWERDCTLTLGTRRRVFDRSRLLTRLLRLDIMALRRLGDGARVAIGRDGIYRADPDETEMHRTFTFEAGRPLNLDVDGRGRLVFGEYRSNHERGAIRIFASDDGGRSFEVRHVFAAGQIRHVHSITWDPHLGRCLVLTGDYGEECGIGVLGEDLEGVAWIVRGGQRFRAASILVDESHIMYGTDTHVAVNAIIRIDKASGRHETMDSTEGSSLYAARFGRVSVISTAVEPSPVNRSREVSLWLSVDGEHWHREVVGRKDRWHPTYLQFGTFVLPHVVEDASWGAFGGQAIEGVDGHTWLVDFHADYVRGLESASG